MSRKIPNPAQQPGFSVVKAVKSNARDRVGPPPPGRVIPTPEERRTARAAKHKPTLAGLLQEKED